MARAEAAEYAKLSRREKLRLMCGKMRACFTSKSKPDEAAAGGAPPDAESAESEPESQATTTRTTSWAERMRRGSTAKELLIDDTVLEEQVRAVVGRGAPA